MKHSTKITFVLLGIFLLAQIVGMVVVLKYMDTSSGEFSDLPFDAERPEATSTQSVGLILGAIVLGTMLVLLIMKWNQILLWKIWFFLSVLVTLLISFTPFVGEKIALVIASIFGFFKIFKPNFWIHNISEVFIYGGLAAIFVPILNFNAIFWILIFISLYDMYAVWKSKHMIKMAKQQSKANIFAGIMIPYKMPQIKKGTHKVKVKTAILGGGDIGFPLLFAGVVLKELVLTKGVLVGFLETLFVPLGAATGLFLLLYYSKENKFYPAMPFVTAGCFAGFIITFLVSLI